jgi:hypothetical protein
MTRMNGRRAGLGGLLAAALGVLALLALPGVAAAKDRNHDRIPDRWEKRHHLSLKANQARRDQDRDQLRNLAEFKAGDNPRDPDTDNNGIEDGEENAGTIASFDTETGKLTIDLFGGDEISGLVTESTEIECNETQTSSASISSDGESGDGRGDEAGEEPGDDNGEAEEEPGDDNGDNSGEDDNGSGGNCTTAALVPGATVHEAELNLENGAATFDKVELAG